MAQIPQMSQMPTKSVGSAAVMAQIPQMSQIPARSVGSAVVMTQITQNQPSSSPIPKTPLPRPPSATSVPKTELPKPPRNSSDQMGHEIDFADLREEARSRAPPPAVPFSLLSLIGKEDGDQIAASPSKDSKKPNLMRAMMPYEPGICSRPMPVNLSIVISESEGFLHFISLHSNPIQSNPIQSNPIQSNPIQSNPIQSNPC